MSAKRFSLEYYNGVPRIFDAHEESYYTITDSYLLSLLNVMDKETAALRERVKVLEDALLISGNNLADVKNFLEIEIKVCSGVGMEYELGLVESIDAFQDLHGEMVKELGEKHAALRGEA